MSAELFATESEIRNASSILLPEGHCFFDDPQKRAIIESNESMSVKACPGSGKTTTLLAKLIILANRFPFEDGRGICVLTHTNVAIDEIKARLGAKSDILFRYPNFFGTIQAFVDRFLAIPELELRHGALVPRIDDDISEQVLQRNIRKKGNWQSSIFMFLRNRKLDAHCKVSFEKLVEDLSIPENKVTGFKAYLIRKQIIKITNQKTGQLKYTRNLFSKKELVKRLSEFSKAIPLFLTEKSRIEDLVEIDVYSEVKNIRVNIDKKTVEYGNTSFNIERDFPKEILELKEQMHRQGFLNFEDAFDLALGRINKYPQLKNAFSLRFKHLFVDETQDSDEKQLLVIESLFDSSETTIQMFGDPHQAIFHGSGSSNCWNPTPSLPIESSKRFGESIAKVLRTTCVEENANLRPNPSVNSATPVMIVFEDPAKVLPIFSTLLTTTTVEIDGVSMNILEASTNDEKPIKAVGWVGGQRSDGRLTIPSYFNDFEKDLGKKEKSRFFELESYIYTESNAGAKGFFDRILDAVLHLLEISGIRREIGERKHRFTKTSFYSSLEERSDDLLDQFRESCAFWGKQLLTNATQRAELIKEIKAFLEAKLLPVFGVDIINAETRAFLDASSPAPSTTSEASKPNCYTLPGHPDSVVHLSTIHSVKGETHAATLYLETSFYNKYESERIKEQLLGIPFKPRKSDTYIRETLKVAYVAMSRPKYLLCFAVHIDRYKPEFNIENKGNWKVVFA